MSTGTIIRGGTLHNFQETFMVVPRAWQCTAMLGCSTVCPNCRHEFPCCRPCCSARRSLHALSGGGLIGASSPQVSPSAPLAFVLPSFPLVPAPILTATAERPEKELQRLSDTVRQLRESGWYHEGLSYQQSVELLKDTTPGTFLVRDSSDPRFLFALSVQTKRGPTSVRLHYVDGLFRLDAQPHLAPVMPMFPSVLDLVQHYVANTHSVRPSTGGAQVWVDEKGKMYSPILLTRPLRRNQEAPSLKHLARMAVHKALQSSSMPRLRLLPPPHTQLELPPSLTNYLAEYPHSL